MNTTSITYSNNPPQNYVGCHLYKKEINKSRVEVKKVPFFMTKNYEWDYYLENIFS